MAPLSLDPGGFISACLGFDALGTGAPRSLDPDSCLDTLFGVGFAFDGFGMSFGMSAPAFAPAAGSLGSAPRLAALRGSWVAPSASCGIKVLGALCVAGLGFF